MPTSLYFLTKNVWVTKQNPEFDVTMVSYEGAEICIGLYLRDILTKGFGKQNIGYF